MFLYFRGQMRAVWFPKLSDGCLWCFDTGWQWGGHQGHTRRSNLTWGKWRNSADFHSLLRCEEMWAKVWLVRSGLQSVPSRHDDSLTQGGRFTDPPLTHCFSCSPSTWLYNPLEQIHHHRAQCIHAGRWRERLFRGSSSTTRKHLVATVQPSDFTYQMKLFDLWLQTFNMTQRR